MNQYRCAKAIVEMFQMKFPFVRRTRSTNTPETDRDLSYYENINKVFWVVASDNDHFKQYEKVPCIFVETIIKNGKKDRKILQFDNEIEFDEYHYTAWRKVIGKKYGIYVDVLLIKDGKLYTLDCVEIDFDTLGRSDVMVDKKFLGIMAINNVCKTVDI